MNMKTTQPILLVEDDVVDAKTVRRALKDINVKNDLVVAGNGEKALEYLRDGGSQRPCIIMLDLNMPRMNGNEFLEIVKADEALRRIPVVVLTTSRDERDRRQTFDQGVAGYMIKPVEYPQFVEVVRGINLYWTLSELAD